MTTVTVVTKVTQRVKCGEGVLVIGTCMFKQSKVIWLSGCIVCLSYPLMTLGSIHVKCTFLLIILIITITLSSPEWQEYSLGIPQEYSCHSWLKTGKTGME